MKSNLPKVLQPLAGRPLLAHVLDAARAVAPARIVVVYGFGAEQVKAAFTQPDLHWALQDPPQGTGHAVQMAMPHLTGEGVTVVLSGDVPFIQKTTIQRLAKAAEGNALVLLTARPDDPSGLGRIERTAAGDVERIVEEKDARVSGRADLLASNEIYTGVMAAPSAWLKQALTKLTNNNAQGEYYLTELAAIAGQEGMRIVAVESDLAIEWAGINDKVQLAQFERAHQAELAEKLMRGGVTLADPARIDIRGELICGSDVFIDVGCVFEGKVQLASNVRVGAHCVLRDATIGANADIAPFTHIDAAICGDGVKLGPYARLRPGTTLADDVHIGNFTEVKNSQIGKGSKANHLAYVGDATIGARVNVGAGTITCNYDGANKYRTVIEDDAFIGSDSQLVAPVTIHAGATLGAGTTLTKDAPANALTISRAKQVTIDGWKRPVKSKKG